MRKLRFGVIGCGFWAPYQIAAWHELDGVELAAVYNRTRAKAEAVAARFGARVHDDAESLLRNESLDFVDVISSPETHRGFVELAAAHRVPVICQKPMATDWESAEAMVRVCREAGVPFFVHENHRWHRPVRRFRELMGVYDRLRSTSDAPPIPAGLPGSAGRASLSPADPESGVGPAFRGRLTFSCSFPVFDNQPSLRDCERFIVLDVGSHLLDVARFLFGEARRLWCHTRRITPGIRGEDVATVMMDTERGATVLCELSYASRLEHERFPQTYVLAECERGSIELGPDYWVRATDASGTHSRRWPPERYEWADPRYDLTHAAIVECNRNLLGALRGEAAAETTGEDNLRTMRLVFAAYESAASGRCVDVACPSPSGGPEACAR